MDRTNITSGVVWEDKVGYSRAVRAGDFVFVSGTTAIDENGKIAGKGDAYIQAELIIAKIAHALKQAGGGLKDVVQTRIYVTDISKWEQVARAHSHAFGKIKPATVMVEVKALIHRDMLVEIEATAIL